MALLEVKDLHTSFRLRGGVVRAVDGVTFEVSEGETLALAGESGCGKSVTALSLMRLLSEPPARISPGQIMFDGQDILSLSEDEMRRIRGNRMAIILQDPMTSLNPLLTVGHQISEAVELHLGAGRKAARRRAIELLELVGIPNASKRTNDYPHQFSGGMRQRVTIAAALSCNPKLILADEITTALDVTIQAQVLEILGNVTRDFGTAVLLITHDLGVVAGMSQRVHIMYAGQIVEMALTTDLFSDPRMPYTWGLLRSIPRLDQARRVRLRPIEGAPPDLAAPSSGCRFAPRCGFRRPICYEKEPELLPIAGTQRAVRCWGAQDVPGGGWLEGVDWREADGEDERDAGTGAMS